VEVLAAEQRQSVAQDYKEKTDAYFPPCCLSSEAALSR